MPPAISKIVADTADLNQELAAGGSGDLAVRSGIAVKMLRGRAFVGSTLNSGLSGKQNIRLSAPLKRRPVKFTWPTTTKADLLNAGISAQWEILGAECDVRLAGRITIDSSPGLREFLLQRLESEGFHILSRDFHDVPYIDTSGLAVLVEMLKAARNRGKQLHLNSMPERPRYYLEAVRLLPLFDGVDTLHPGNSA